MQSSFFLHHQCVIGVLDCNGNTDTLSYLCLFCRFRSITKQYFRKADGVLVMYDVTSEVSFKNVRNWMISVQVAKVFLS